MRSSCFSEGQMAPILREADTEPVSEAAKPRGIREVTIYAWRKRYDEVEAADLRRLRQMKTENARLKRVLAYRYITIDVMEDVIEGIPDKASGALHQSRA